MRSLLFSARVVFVLVFTLGGGLGCEKKPRIALDDGRDDYQERTISDAELAASVAAATADGKRVLLMFGGDWCVWCHALHKTFDGNAEVKAALDAGFVLQKVDIETNEALDERFGKPSKKGFPVLVVVGEDGSKLHVQETGSLETGKKGEIAHDPVRVLAFLQQWSTANTAEATVETDPELSPPDDPAN